MSCDVGEVTERLENEQSSFYNLSFTSPTSQLILHCFTYVIAHSLTLPLLHLRRSSFSNPLASPDVLWYRWSDGKVTTHSPTHPSLYLRHSSFSNPSIVSPMPQFILQPFFCFSYITSYSFNSPGGAAPMFPPFRRSPCNNQKGEYWLFDYSHTCNWKII